MIKSKEVVHLLVFLIINCHCRQGTLVMAGNFYPDQNINADTGLYQQATSYADLEQPRSDNSASQDNLRHYLLKDLNLEGYTQRPSLEQWNLIRLNQLLDSLSSSIPTPAPIFRGSRTISSSSTANIDSAKREVNSRPNYPINQQFSMTRQQLVVKPNGELEQQLPAADGRGYGGKKTSLFGLIWPPTRQPNAGYVNVRRSQASPQPNSHHTPGTEEVPLHAPKHSRSVSDYEWKRVENSRWNNLRGMWGKRSARQDTFSAEDENKTPLLDGDEEKQ